MTDDNKLNEIATRMKVDFPSMSHTYLYCIARQAVSGEKSGEGAYAAVSRYFCAWSDSFNRELVDSFNKHREGL